MATAFFSRASKSRDGVSSRRRDTGYLRRILALFTILLLLPLPHGLLNPAPAHAQAQGSLGGFLELTSVFFGEGTRTFGPGQVVTISGSIPFVPWCPSMALHGVSGRGEGFFDFFPVADFYVIKDDGQPLQPYQKLEDVNGTPNRVTGLANGVFVDEVVGITKPAGNLGPGRYKIVMDQCLDGHFDPFIDIVLGDPPNLGFEVQDAGTLPPINYHLLKDRAKDYAEELSGTSVGALGVSVQVPGFCKLYGKLVGKLPQSGSLFSFGKIALDRCSDLIAEQKGIASDPPDPNYTQFADLGSLAYDFADAPQTPLERTTRDLAHVLSEQAAITKALLTSVERFQGAQAASDDAFTILQMKAASKYIDLLIGPGGALLRFYADLEAFDSALQQDPAGSLPEAADLHAFIPEMRQAVSGLLRPLGTELQDIRQDGKDTFMPIGMQEWITVYAGEDPFLPTLGLPGIPQVRAQNGLPPLSFHHPVARISGPYNVPPRRTITLDASKSSDPDGESLTFAWDLIGSGTFSDATGSATQYSFAQPGTRLVGVKATDPEGNSNVAYTLVRVGDVSAQDIIAMQLSRELFRVSPDGHVAQLKAGLGYNLGGLQALHVDVNKDIWVLNNTSIEHYNSEGVLLRTFTLQDVQQATGVLLQSMTDFALDGRGDLIILGPEELGPGIEDIVPYFSLGADLAGRDKLIRMSKDGSSGRLIAEVSQNYLSLQTINGVLHEEIDARGGAPTEAYIALSIDPDGFIIVAGVDYPLDGIPRQGGFLRVDPDTGDVSVLIPPAVPLTGYGPLSRNAMVFGNFSFNFGPDPGPARLAIDRNGQFVISSENNVGFNVRLYRILNPLQITEAVPPGLIVTFRYIQAFPVLPVTANSPVMYLNQIAIDSAGDYVGTGNDGAGLLGSGIFRTSPVGELGKVADLPGTPRVMDVVPLERAVTPKDMPSDPTVHLDALTISQDTCPGAATLKATVSNTGSGVLNAPVRVLWLDGDPEGGGTVIGSALVPVPLAPGASVNVSAAWPNPTPGTHQVFAEAMGANTVSTALLVCVPTNFVANPVVLSPPYGTANIGNSYTVSAKVTDALGNGVSGIPVTFNVSNTNSASGTVDTDSSGAAAFSYNGTAAGSDNIVATVTGATSNTVTAAWQGVGNQPPIANAGPDQVVEATSPAGATVTLSGAGSSDPENDPLSFTWTGLFGTLTGVSVSPTLPLGMTSVSLAVNDGQGNTANDSVNVTVRDTTSPLVTPPAAITVPATESGGARGNDWIALAAFLAGGSATDAADPAPTRLAAQAGGVNVDNNTLFATGTTTPVAFRFQDASGNLGTVTADVSVILGTPRISGLVRAKGRDASGALYVDVQFTNLGTGNARNLRIGSLLFRTLSGTGTVSYNAALSPAVPITIGSLDAGFSVMERLYLDVPSTVTRLSITESGPVQDVIGTNYNFSTGQAVYP